MAIRLRTQTLLKLAGISERQLYYWNSASLLSENRQKRKLPYKNWTLAQALIVVGIAKRRNYRNPIDGERMSIQEIREHVPLLLRLAAKYSEETLLACNLVWYGTFRLAQRDFVLPKGYIFLFDISSIAKS